VRKKADQWFGKQFDDRFTYARSSGNEALDTMAFLHMLEQLKVQKRSGWIREGVSLSSAGMSV